MTVVYVLWFIVKDEPKGAPTYPGTSIKKLDNEKGMRAYALDATTPALPAVGRASCSSPISHGIEPRAHEASGHDYQTAWPYKTATGVNNGASSRVNHVRNMEYCLSHIQICKWWKNFTSRVHSIYERYLQKKWILKFGVMLADVPTSSQAHKWRPNSTCWMGCT